MTGRDEFIEAVCRDYALTGEPRRVERVEGGAHVVWRLTTGPGDYLIKELPVEREAALHAAVSFERAAFKAHVVPMAEPCPDREGELLRQLVGSRGGPVIVRVHRYLTGIRAVPPVAAHTAREAGRSLASIHDFGQRWAAAGGCLPVKRRWNRPDRELFTALAEGWPDLVPDPDSAWALLTVVQHLTQQASDEPSRQPSHADHKPDNSLLDGDRLIVIDWDEAGTCDPRIDTLVTAVRWSWAGSEGPRPELIAAFADGYRQGGRLFPTVRESDWATWVAGIADWFEFHAQRARGDWPAVASSAEQDARSAVQTLHGLRSTLDRIPGWTRMINSAVG